MYETDFNKKGGHFNDG